MPDERAPDLGLFLDILDKLEALDIPYTVIGAFAGAIYGVTRVTYDIDIVVQLSGAHVEALAACYPAPRAGATTTPGVKACPLSRLGERFSRFLSESLPKTSCPNS